jgi:hypothetical protein
MKASVSLCNFASPEIAGSKKCHRASGNPIKKTNPVSIDRDSLTDKENER